MNNERKQIRFYKTLAVLTLLYGKENWILRKRDESRIQSDEITFLRSVKGCSRSERITNDDIREEVNIFAIRSKLLFYKQKCTEYLDKTPDERLSKSTLNYRLRGRR
jgi:hypothetical protein